jgi:hypothetical protein
MSCLVPESQRRQRTACPCGGMNTVRVVVEFVLFGNGTIDYAGGRFCYHSDALISIEIPPGATPIRALLYDLHQPDEIIRIEFTQAPRRRMSPDAGHDVPGKAGDIQGAYLGLGTAGA